jgi:hypothetical protein
MFKKDGKITVLNEKFPIDQALAYEFVWATLDTKEQQLKIYHNEKNDTTRRLVKILHMNLMNL